MNYTSEDGLIKKLFVEEYTRFCQENNISIENIKLVHGGYLPRLPKVILQTVKRR
ncbi:MAG: hypothetical protein HC932_01220 [Thermales bacterium]|nr:hypothetical protein [Thermales bacterium]